MKCIFGMRNKFFSVGIIGFFILFIIACGGGGGGSTGTASPPAATYSISGTVTGAANVTIDLTGAATASTSTDTSGNYSFTGLGNGSYTVTPVKSLYIFAPSNATVSVSANVTGVNFAASLAPTYTQADLTGNWIVHYLKTGNSPQWSYYTAAIDSSGHLTTFSSCLDSTGSTTCPSNGTLTWTIDGNGVITESGSGASSNTKMTMTSNKNFIAGTDGSSPSTASGVTEELRIIQKVTGTYNSADLHSKNFVYHQLTTGTSGTSNAWGYGAGSIDGFNVINISSSKDPSGSVTPEVYGTLSLNTTTGIVTMSGSPTFQGFLADDKKTIVGTETVSTNYRLVIIQVTGRTYITPDDLAGIYTAHYISEISDPFVGPINAGVNAFWINDTMTVNSSNSANVTQNNVTSSWSLIIGFDPGTAAIDTSGAITSVYDANLNGQMSNDGKFAVFTVTQWDPASANNYYMLFVITK